MILGDPKKLARLMTIQEISQRELAKRAGWSSHTYLNRLLQGEVKSLKPDAALRIAKALGVGVDDLFLVKVSSNPAPVVQSSKVPA